MNFAMAFILVFFLGWLIPPGQLEAQSKSAEKPIYGGKLTYGSLRDVRTTNPFRNTYSHDYNVRALMFEGLTGLDKDHNVVPVLATSWDISKDGRTYTLSLRNNVKFHNGHGLNSEDVKWSLEYMLDAKNKAYYHNQLVDVTSVEARNPSIAVIKLRRPFSPLITVLATTRAPIVPAGSKMPPTSYPPGTGPFQFERWQSGQLLVVKKFKDYWIPGVPYLDQIIFKPIQDDAVRVTAIRAREVDFAEELPYAIAKEELKKTKPDFLVIRHEAADRRRIVFNTRKPPFNDVRIRQAVAFALDKQELVDTRTWGFSKPSNQRFPESSKWYIAEVKDRERDLEKAKALLAEAGHKDGLTFKAPVYPGPDMRLTTVIKDQLRKVGLDVELDVMDWQAHSKVRRALKFTFYSAGMGGRADPNMMYYMDLYSKSRGNGSGYSNPELDKLLDKAKEVLDLEERKRLYTEVLKIVQRDVPEIYLNIGPKLHGVLPRVKGFASGLMEERFAYVGGGVAYTWIDDKG